MTAQTYQQQRDSITAMAYDNPHWRPLIESGKVVAVSECKTAREALELSRLNYRVSLRPLMTQDGLRVPKDMPCYATVRDDTEDVLGVVGKDYMPLQNDACCELLDAITGTGKAKYETCGSLDNGRRIWFQIKTSEIEVVPGDTIGQYLLLSTAHDGSQAVRISFTGTRFVCWNQIGGVLSNQEKATGRVFTARHTTNILGRVEEAAGILGIARQQASAAEELYVAMSHVYPTSDQIEEVLEQLFPVSDEESDRAVENARKKREGVLQLFEEGENNILPGIEGSAWGLYNAATEWQQHYQYKKYDPQARLDSQWFGTGAEQERKAFQLVSAMV